MVKAAALRTPVAALGEMTCNRVMPNPVNALIASKTDAAGRLPNFGFWSGRRLAYAEPVVIGKPGPDPVVQRAPKCAVSRPATRTTHHRRTAAVPSVTAREEAAPLASHDPASCVTVR